MDEIWMDTKDALAITMFAVVALAIILIMGFYSVLFAAWRWLFAQKAKKG